LSAPEPGQRVRQYIIALESAKFAAAV
jgi:hypothetical protein